VIKKAQLGVAFGIDLERRVVKGDNGWNGGGGYLSLGERDVQHIGPVTAEPSW
jgi:hypothetical protein